MSDTLTLDMVEQGKGTRMGHAVNSMIQYINRPSSGRRPDVPLHIVAITDGNSFDDITEPGSRSRGQFGDARAQIGMSFVCERLHSLPTA